MNVIPMILSVLQLMFRIYKLFRSKEASTSVRPLYVENQPYINERMRSILVDWLVEVHLKFKLVPETLYLTVILIDRYLAKTEVSRAKVQLVGVTALLISHQSFVISYSFVMELIQSLS